MSRKLAHLNVLMAAALSTALCLNLSTGVKAQAVFNEEPNLQPGVWEYIRKTGGNFGASEFPDSNEPLEVIKTYLTYRDFSKEVSRYKSLVQRFPDSRHVHEALANAYEEQYEKTSNKEFAVLALQEWLHASEIALTNEHVLYLTGVEESSVKAGNPEAAKQWFTYVLQQKPGSYAVTYALAKLLRATNDKETEQFLLKAIRLHPTGNSEAEISYTEYLLDKGRYQEAVEQPITMDVVESLYMNFLRAYALEKLNRGEESSAYYQKYADFSQFTNTPKRYQIEGSLYQQGIVFNDEKSSKVQSSDVIPLVTSPGLTDLQYVIACESSTEPIGGQHQTAWSVRQRVNRGTIPSCLSVSNSGSSEDQNTKVSFARLIRRL